jgi:hypothetical protein
MGLGENCHIPLMFSAYVGMNGYQNVIGKKLDLHYSEQK